MAQPLGRASSTRLAAYAAPTISTAAIGLAITVYLPDYYHTELGVDLARFRSCYDR
ncbi:MAG: hypothetical protein AAGB25_04400 [Pseudomonadota bacterium]